MPGKTQALRGHISDLRKMRKLERLSLIKERYRKLILDPRRNLEMQLDQDDYEDDIESPRDYEADLGDVFQAYFGGDDEID